MPVGNLRGKALDRNTYDSAVAALAKIFDVNGIVARIRLDGSWNKHEIEKPLGCYSRRTAIMDSGLISGV